MIAAIERETKPVAQQEPASLHDHPDQLWDGHGLLVAMLLILALVLVSIVAIIGLNIYESEKPAATSAMPIIALDWQGGK